MTAYPLSRCAASPCEGDDALCCGAALAGRPADALAPVPCAVAGITLLESLA